ncbi:hypothetical protein [Bythopirellula goksoeyrii]|uniref:Uncharacterized protein n=1 Tax=Bythopirellula goksoeyrii TaxID=1400387 RepID=A0A5B9QE64_9BACT|nr:hypothetical protein [Bythopirellula goksoeyrii]QEG37347.1 hypothetical protein Pr1d_46880 [Bythopirellula goksoeyrii]
MTLREPHFEQRLKQSDTYDRTYVQPEEYRRLLLSWRKMERVYENGGRDVCGLMDLQSGKQYLIERHHLMRD